MVEANHGSPYDSLAPIVRGLFSGNDALALWQGIGTGAAYLVAYCIGGYVAGRMARFSSAKQGISVWLWQVMIMFAASLLTYFTPQVFQGGSANLSVQWYMQHGTASAILSVALVLCITFIGCGSGRPDGRSLSPSCGTLRTKLCGPGVITFQAYNPQGI